MFKAVCQFARFHVVLTFVGDDGDVHKILLEFLAGALGCGRNGFGKYFNDTEGLGICQGIAAWLNMAEWQGITKARLSFGLVTSSRGSFITRGKTSGQFGQGFRTPDPAPVPYFQTI